MKINTFNDYQYCYKLSYKDECLPAGKGRFSTVVKRQLFMRSPIIKRILAETPKEVTDRVRLYARIVVLINKIHRSAPNKEKPD